MQPTATVLPTEFCHVVVLTHPAAMTLPTCFMIAVADVQAALIVWTTVRGCAVVVVDVDVTTIVFATDLIHDVALTQLTAMVLAVLRRNNVVLTHPAATILPTEFCHVVALVQVADIVCGIVAPPDS